MSIRTVRFLYSFLILINLLSIVAAHDAFCVINILVIGWIVFLWHKVENMQ